MTYPYRLPLSKILARLGVTLTISVDVYKDDDVGVYVATSKDVAGLIIEAESLENLHEEVTEAIPMLLNEGNNSNRVRAFADVLYRDHIAIA